jgi:hypothetical protein
LSSDDVIEEEEEDYQEIREEEEESFEEKLMLRLEECEQTEDIQETEDRLNPMDTRQELSVSDSKD